MISNRLYMTPAASDPGYGYTTEGITLAGTQYSSKITNRFQGVQVHLIWTGTPTCDVTLWGSNVEDPDESDDTDWTADSDWGTAGTLALGGAAGDYGKKLEGAFRWYRLKSVLGAGAGTLRGVATVQGANC